MKTEIRQTRVPAFAVLTRMDTVAVRSAPRAHSRGKIDVALPVRRPFDAVGVFQFLAARAVAGVEVADLSSGDRLRYARTLTLPHGPAAFEVVAAHDDRGGWRLNVLLELASPADMAPAVARVGRMLDLDADPVAIDVALAADPALAPLVARTPGIRVPGAVDPHELVVRALVGQQISVAAARTHLGRLTARCGSPHASNIAGLTRLFPTPAQIAAGIPEPAAGGALDPERPLRLPRRSIGTVVNVSRALNDGELVVDVGTDAETLRAQLTARPGVGPWTASYIAMRVLGDPDAWLDGDVALIAGAKALGLLEQGVPKATGHRVIAARAAAWAPWRSYAVMHLWRAADSVG